MSTSMSRSSTWLSADAPPHASPRPSMHGEEAERGHALGADEHPRCAREQEQRHDPRLRQRQVVASSSERQRCREAPRRPGAARRRAPHRPRRHAARSPTALRRSRRRPAERDRDEEQRDRADCLAKSRGYASRATTAFATSRGSATSARPQCVVPSSSTALTTTRPTASAAPPADSR